MNFYEPNSNDIFGVAVDPQSGDVFLTGWTMTWAWTAARSPARRQPPATDASVFRVDPALTTILKAASLGGSENDYGYAIAIHPKNGDVYVIGQTYSADFPDTANGARAHSVAVPDGFVARLNPDLSRVVQSTYLGGFGEDVPHALAFDPASGDALVAGMTLSDDFPRCLHAAQPEYGGGDAFLGGDGFVSRLTGDLLDTAHECAIQNTSPCLNGREPEPAPQGRSTRSVARPD